MPHLKLPPAERKSTVGSHEHTFSTMNCDTFTALPVDLQEMFPAVLREGIIPNTLMSKNVAALLTATVSESNGLSPNRMAYALAEVRAENHGRDAHGYYSRAVDELQYLEHLRGKNPDFTRELGPVPAFGEHTDSLFLGQLTPSAKVLWGYVEDLLGKRKEHSRKRMALETIWHWDGMLKNDATFNLAKQVRQAGSTASTWPGPLLLYMSQLCSSTHPG